MRIQPGQPISTDDNSEIAHIYNNYFPKVYNYVHYRVDDFHDADDLVSQIFEKLFTKLPYYQSEKAVFAAWLFSIARNAVIDYYRSQKRRQGFWLEIADDLADPNPVPVDLVIYNEKQQRLKKALAALNQRERDIIAMKFWSGLSNKEIASFMDISESNTGIILFRAMRRLRIILASEEMNVYE